MKDVKAIVNFPALSAEEDIKKEKSRAREFRRSSSGVRSVPLVCTITVELV